MSEKKFNLKTYQKINGSEHIDMRLEESRSKTPDVINEKQLDSYRSPESDVTIEKLLESKRLGEETEITEKRLDTHKPKFANKYRNPSAHEGDMNKLEEQRLQGDPSEKEKYEVASSVGKKMRWWEDVKSPDGLKVAKVNDKKTVTAKRDDYDDPQESVEEMEFGKPRWDDVAEEDADAIEPQVLSDAEDFEVDEVAPSALMGDLSITKEKYLSNVEKPYLSGIYMVLSYDPEAFKGNESEIKDAAMEKVLSVKPELAGLISADDFVGIKEEGGVGSVTLRAAGEEFASIASQGKSTSPISEEGTEGTEDLSIEELSFREIDMEGTPMSVGRIGVNGTITDENRDSYLSSVVDFIREKHPNLNVEIDSLDTSDLVGKGEVRFMVGTPMGSSNVPVSGDYTYNEALSPEQNADLQRRTEMTPNQELEEKIAQPEVDEEIAAMEKETPLAPEDILSEEELRDPTDEEIWKEYGVEDFPVEEVTKADSSANLRVESVSKKK